jgi:hypothetical protein
MESLNPGVWRDLRGFNVLRGKCSNDTGFSIWIGSRDINIQSTRIVWADFSFHTLCHIISKKVPFSLQIPEPSPPSSEDHFTVSTFPGSMALHVQPQASAKHATLLNASMPIRP